MKILIAEDDFNSRKMMKAILSDYGDCETAEDGEKAIQAFRSARDTNAPFDLICMDIMMPNIDRLQALKKIREIEKEQDIGPDGRVKVIMTTVLDNPKTIYDAIYRGEADAYVFKPVRRLELMEEMYRLNLLGKKD